MENYNSKPLFGFSIEDKDKLPKEAISPIPQNNEDGVDWYLSSGFFGSSVDIEGIYRTESELIQRYREMALHPEVDGAIEDIVNEALVSDTYDSPVEIELSNLNASDGLKKKIREEFKNILKLLDFDKKCHEIYRNWYVDGRLYYHKVIDLKNPRDGILDLRYIDSLKIRYVRKEKKQNTQSDNIMPYGRTSTDKTFPEIDEYFEYNPQGSSQMGGMTYGQNGQGVGSGIRIAKDAIAYCNSGLVDLNKKIVLSYLHKSIKSLNQLRMIEDSLVIYRLCLIGDTRVKTDNGYSYIKDIQIGDTVYTYDNNVNKLVPTQVSNKWLTGTKQTFKVSSKHHSVVGTDTHPILVFDYQTKEVGYVAIKDIEPKRHYLTYIKPEDHGIMTEFPEVRESSYKLKNKTLWSSYDIKNKEEKIKELSTETNINHNSIRNFLYGGQSLESSNLAVLQKNLDILNDQEYEEKISGFCRNTLNLPKYINEEFSRLFGFLLGDGSIGKYCVTFAEGEDQIQNEYYCKLMTQFFGNCKRINSNRKYSNYTTSNTLASELMTKLGFVNGSKNKRIPNWLFNSPNCIKKEFILGLLDADGHYRDLINGFSCEISLANKKLIEDIKEIWTSIGLCSGQIRHRIRPEQTRVIGNELIERIMPETECWELYLSEYELTQFEKIQKVEIKEIEEVYDIEVSHEKHNFVANGIVVHNSRAPERRIFYIDVGNLPTQKAEQHMQDVMRRYRNKQVYDASTGELRDAKKFTSMLEDFWLPRREGGRGTQVETLPGGQNLGEIKDIEYFKEKLYRSLNVPPTRMQGGQGFNMGRSSEILRDELKFTKFVGRLRKRFSDLLNNLLSTQLILKNIITPDDWVKMNQHIQYDFLYDNHFSELKDSELMTERLNLAATVDPYVGIYYSRDFVRRKILRQTDQDIIDQDKIIKQEIKDGVIADPSDPIDPMTGMPLDGSTPPPMGGAAPAINGQMGKVPIDQMDREPKSNTAGKPVKGI